MTRFDKVLSVFVAAPLDKPLSYKADVPVEMGQFVLVPLGGREVVGLVKGQASDIQTSKLKLILRVLPFAPLRQETLVFLEHAARYTLAPVGMFAKLMTSAPGLAEPYSPPEKLVPTGVLPQRLTPARQKVIACLEGHAHFTSATDLAEAAGVGAGVVRGLEKEGAVKRIPVPPAPMCLQATPDRVLSEEQQAAADTLCALIGGRSHKTALLQGVTGSGKTEIYLEAIMHCLRMQPNAQVLILLPEITLSAIFAKRIRDRFGDSVKQWHSGLTPVQRRAIWEGVNKNEVRIVVGARSALFLPFRNLHLIVVDEEHDTSFKQEDGVLYNARDMAVLYGAKHAIPVILSSATPSLETWVNAQAGKYTRVVLDKRFGTAVMPVLKTIDLREHKLPPNRWISEPLLEAMRTTIAAKEQVLLFLNRRGYAPLTLCRTCGHRLECRHCSAWMVEHRALGKMMCHQCGFQSAIPKNCPECHNPTLAACGPGIERLAEEVAELFPEARQAVLSSDLFASTAALQERIHQIAHGDHDIIIGTQLVTKGYTFPRLTLVGVIDADLGLHGTDLRAAERTFQVLQQVAGRAGRVEAQGCAMLQTTTPDHSVMQALISGEVEAFWQAEAAQRQAARVAPYSRMAGIIISGKHSDQVWAVARGLAQTPIAQFVDVLGPAQAPIGLLRGKHRVRFLLKAPRRENLQAAIEAWRLQVKIPSAVRVVVDIDPQSFM